MPSDGRSSDSNIFILIKTVYSYYKLKRKNSKKLNYCIFDYFKLN